MASDYPQYFGTITYVAKCDELGVLCEFPRTDLSSDISGVQNVEVENSSGNELTINVALTSQSNTKTLYELAERAAEKIVNLLAFSLPIAAHDIKWKNSDLWIKPNESDPPREIMNPIVFRSTFANLRCRHGFTPESLKKRLMHVPLENEPYIAHFRLAITAQTGIERFMNFYQLLLFMTRDADGEERFANVDKFIRKNGPSTPEPNSPRSGKPETIYTRLRHEFAHCRTNADFRKTRAEMEQRWGELMEFCRKAIAVPHRQPNA